MKRNQTKVYVTVIEDWETTKVIRVDKTLEEAMSREHTTLTYEGIYVYEMPIAVHHDFEPGDPRHGYKIHTTKKPP